MAIVRKWRVYFNTIEFYYSTIDFEKTHPSPYPDTFTIVLPDKITSITSFQPVEIKRDGVTIFYGYVEKVEWDSNEDTIISGRCRKLICWKKWTERFVEARENISGFMGIICPEELFKFMLRCPISDVAPEDEEWAEYPLCKIGWGINSSEWACTASNMSAGTDPIYTKLRVDELGFYWRNRGNDYATTTLEPNGCAGGAMIWTENPAGCGAPCAGNPWNCIDAIDTCSIYTATDNARTYADGYHFEDLSVVDATASGINHVKLGVYLRCEWFFVWGVTVSIMVEIYDGTAWTILGYIKYFCQGFGNGPYWTAYLDAGHILDSVAKVDAARVRFTKINGSAGITARIDYVSLGVDYSQSGTQAVGDQFMVNLGKSHSRVCGIIINSRHSEDQYAKNYKIECATTDESILGETTECGSSLGLGAGSISIFGAWTVPAGGISVNGIWAYIDTAGGEQIKGVIYRKTDGVAGYTLQGTGTQVTVTTVGVHWQWLPFATPVSLTAGWEIYLGLCLAAGDTVTIRYDTNATLKNRYTVYLANCTPPDPFGVPDESDIGTRRWSIYCVCGGDYIQVASKTNNVCRDIIHSWQPRTAQFIRITITVQDASHSWEITQIYVYEADDYDYCVIDEGGGGLGPYLNSDLSNIVGKTEEADHFCILPFNMPYQRLSDALHQVGEMAFNASHIPWEWWIGTTNGKVYFDEHRGTDRSATIKFVTRNPLEPNNVNLGSARHSEDTKKSAQRIKVTGKAKGKRQDEIASNWQVDAAAMVTIGSFYEEIISEKMLTNRETANALAEVFVEKKKNAVQEIEVEIERDPYASGSWDVGDDVTLYDPSANIASGSYRVKKAVYRIDGDGEHITLTVTNAWEDISDKLAALYRRVEDLEMSGIEAEDISAEAEAGKVDADKLDDAWKITRKYEQQKQFIEPDSADPENSESYDTNPAVLPAADGRDIDCRKDELTIKGQGAAGGAQLFTEIWTVLSDTDWNFNPRFKAKLQITGDFVCEVANRDNIIFGIYYRDAAWANWRGFGFKIICDDGIYKVYANKMDGNEENKYIGTIGDTNEFHEFDARVDWDMGYVFYYMDGVPRAVILFNKISSTLHLMAMILISEDRESGQSIVEFYDWTTQVLALPREL